jgi:hypothetical protein
MKTCPTCLGTRTQDIKITNNRVISIPCWRCHGDGEIGEIRKTTMQEQTQRCSGCKGAGTVPRPEYKREKLYDPNPLPCPECDGRSYHHMDTVICGTGDYEPAQPTPGEGRSPVSDALALMRQNEQERSRIVLEIAYGEVGRRVERQLHLPVALSVWPHTSHGKRLLRCVGHYRGEPPFEAMYDALSGDVKTSTLASLANTAAIAMLELALSHLCAADAATGGSITGTARRLKLATCWNKEKK